MSSKILQKRQEQQEQSVVDSSTYSKQQKEASATPKNEAYTHRLRRFEMFKKLNEPLTEDTIYREIRRPVRPSL